MEKSNINIKPNQNLVGLIVGLASVGFAEYFKLTCLFYLGLIVSIIFLISVCFTSYSYTDNYCRNKSEN